MIGLKAGFCKFVAAFVAVAAIWKDDVHPLAALAVVVLLLILAELMDIHAALRGKP